MGGDAGGSIVAAVASEGDDDDECALAVRWATRRALGRLRRHVCSRRVQVERGGHASEAGRQSALRWGWARLPSARTTAVAPCLRIGAPVLICSLCSDVGRLLNGREAVVADISGERLVLETPSAEPWPALGALEEGEGERLLRYVRVPRGSVQLIEGKRGGSQRLFPAPAVDVLEAASVQHMVEQASVELHVLQSVGGGAAATAPLRATFELRIDELSAGWHRYRMDRVLSLPEWRPKLLRSMLRAAASMESG